jgi:CubicO group peptidase (beta-lactamase class C family)
MGVEMILLKRVGTVARLAGAFAGMLCSFSAGQAIAEETPAQTLPVTYEELSKVIDPLIAEWIEKHKGAGAVVTITNRERTVFEKGYGFSDVEARKPFAADSTLVRPGSISKLFTGIAAMQLADRGKLDLDRDVNEYLDFRIPTLEGGVPVTLRRLLRHRAGFEEHLRDLFTRRPDPEPLRSLMPRSLPQRIFPQGNVAAYSNYGMALAGYIVERVSGEPYADYVARHILEPLGMNRSTFKQPLPEALAPTMAKGYFSADKPVGFFETIADSPAGGLSATGADMARFMRALLNGGALDGVRILSAERLQEMMAPQGDETPAGHLGLVFFGGSFEGHKFLGHGGGTMGFLSGLQLLPEEGYGLFFSYDGSRTEGHLPNVARTLAQRFLPKAGSTERRESAAVDAGRITGVYRPSRRSETTFVKVAYGLLNQIRIVADAKGNLHVSSALWPFGKGRTLTPIGAGAFEGPDGGRLYFDGVKFAAPAAELLRVPFSEDVRWVLPALLASAFVLLLTLLAWPVLALWRRWRKSPLSDSAACPRMYAVTRIAALAAATVMAVTIYIWLASRDLSIFSGALDPVLVAWYALAWFTVAAAFPVAWFAAVYWQRSVGSLWTRIHQTLMAGSLAFLAWFFVTFHIAGTTLNY